MNEWMNVGMYNICTYIFTHIEIYILIYLKQEHYSPVSQGNNKTNVKCINAVNICWINMEEI